MITQNDDRCSVLGFFVQKRLDKERIIWYTNSVVNKRGLKIML